MLRALSNTGNLHHRKKGSRPSIDGLSQRLRGIAAVGQLQLLQPFFGLALAAALLHESVTWTMSATTVAVILCVAGARRFAR